ncbi:MAG: hypothetical protein ACRDJU_02975 [Actinomycetota bacterium]
MDDLTQVILGWLLNWCNCPDRGLTSAGRAQVRSARAAAVERAGVLGLVSKEELAAGLDRALRGFPELCPDVPEERRLRMVAHLARILEGGHFPPGVTDGPPATYHVPEPVATAALTDGTRGGAR